jgi:hypothetical protein
VSGIYYCFGREGEKLRPDTVEKRFLVAAPEVGTSYVARKKRIAGEDTSLFCTVISEACRRMTLHEQSF